MSNLLRPNILAGTALGALLIGAPARALDAPQSATARAGQTAGDQIGDIVVTATKRETRLQTTPVAVTAISATTLAKEHVQTIADVVRLVPSFSATTEGDHGVITLTLRGIGNDSAKTEYADPEVALFIDGVYSARAEGASTLLFDLSSIEVLRGPQGTLFGRNSTVGAVNMTTAKPTLDKIYGNVQVGVGDYARFGARGAINLPVSDTLAFRIAFAHEQHDGYVDYQTPKLPSIAAQQAAYAASGGSAASFRPINPGLFITAGQKYSAQDQTAVRASMLFQPTDRLKWNLSYEYFKDRGTLNANLMQQPRPGEKFWSSLVDTRPYLNRDVHTIRSRIDYELSDYLGLAYIAGYSHFTGNSDFDQDSGTHVPTSFATGATSQEDRTDYSRYASTTHELELKSQGTNRLDWIVGLYYAAENNKIRFDIPIFNGTQEGTVGWQGAFIQPKETVESKAAFAQATYHLGDHIRLTGGLRYTDDHRKNVGGTNNGWTGDPAFPQVPLQASDNPDAVGLAVYQHNDGRYHSSRLTYLARADADLARGLFGYASVSSGYKSGGLQDGGLAYKPETLTNYEVGLKATLFGGRMTFNNALFYEDFKGFQFAAPVTFGDGSHGLAFSNAGGSTRVYGLESELAAKVTHDDTISASLSLLHTKLGVLRTAGSNDYSNLPACAADPRISNCLDVTGNSLAHSPTASGTISYEHIFHFANGATLAPRVTTHIESASWLSIFHDGPGDRQKSYTRTDLNLRYSADGDRSWSIELFMRNAEDRRIRTNAYATSDNIYTSQYLAPRTVGANFNYNF